MSAWQVLMNLIVVGGCTLAWRWAGFMGSVLGVALLMVVDHFSPLLTLFRVF